MNTEENRLKIYIYLQRGDTREREFERGKNIISRRSTTIRQCKNIEASTGFEILEIFGNLSNNNFRGAVRREAKKAVKYEL